MSVRLPREERFQRIQTTRFACESYTAWRRFTPTGSAVDSCHAQPTAYA